MARITITRDDATPCGELTDDDETIGDLNDRETAATCIATLTALVNACRRLEGRNKVGVKIVTPISDARR